MISSVEKYYSPETKLEAKLTNEQFQYFLKLNPNFLDQMSDEVRQFFEDQMEKETQEQQKKPGLSKKTLEEWTKNLRQKARKSNKRITDMTEYLQETGRYVGKPGVGPKPYRMMPQPGKPGKPPAPRGI